METQETPQVKDRQLLSSREEGQLLHHYMHLAGPAANSKEEHTHIQSLARDQIEIHNEALKQQQQEAHASNI